MFLTGHMDDDGQELLLHYPFAGGIVTEPVPDCEVMRDFKSVMEEMSKYRRPPDELVKRFLRLHRKVAQAMHEHRLRKIAAFN